jgi:predicted TIM-barrel fold metal-dependent hydrolase
MKIVDFHTHAFPDSLAPRAMDALTDKSQGWDPHHDGTIRGLLASMDRAGIDLSVVASIATRGSQVRPILEWSKSIVSDRIAPFISLHPEAKDNVAVMDEAKAAGIRGVKIHNLYQEFDVDDARMMPLYEAAAERGLVLLFHAGHDPAYEDCTGGAPDRIRKVRDRVPDLRIAAAHSGGWRIWEEVIKHLVGTDVYLEISFTLGQIEESLWERILEGHPVERFVFGTDSPWADQKEYLDMFLALGLSEEDNEKILSGNALRLLGMKESGA